jgi:hypothetical protein
MNEISSQKELKNIRIILKTIGILSIIIGIIFSIIAPLEIYTYYFFSDGGRFHYEGFGIGSFMFAAITFQIIAYYLIGIVFLILGFGHIKLKIWIKTYSLALLKFWLIAGLPLIAVVIIFTAMTKSISLFIGILFLLVSFSLYFIIPFFLLRFYNNNRLNEILIPDKNTIHCINQYPERILILVLIYIFYGICLHIPIFFHGIFPLFGLFLHDFLGTILIVFNIFILVVLIIGTLSRKDWAWWGSILFFLIWMISIIITFLNNSYPEMLTILSFPEREFSTFQRLPLQGYHFILFFSIPLVATIYYIFKSKKHYR